MNFKKIFIVFSLMLCVLFSISCVMASDVNDTMMAKNDEIQAIGQANGDLLSDNNQATNEADKVLSASKDNGTFTALQKKINAASNGATIVLKNNYKYDKGFDTSGISINKSLTIDGKGHTIDALQKSRIFSIDFGLKSNYKVILKNIVFKNAKSKNYGGAVLSFADLTVDNCKFIKNHAGITGGAIASIGSLNLKNSKFDKNSAGGDAAAVFSLNLKHGFKIFYNYSIDIKKTNLDILFIIGLNPAFKHGKDRIAKCTFTNNVAKGRGGAAVYAFSNIDIKSCKFISNKAKEKGAAVYACKNLAIKNSKFHNNKVQSHGGAVYFYGYEQSGKYVKGKWVSSNKNCKCLIENSKFTKNHAKKGGAIYAFLLKNKDKKNRKVVNCYFGANKASKWRDVYGVKASKCIFDYLTVTLKSVKIKKSAKKLVLTAKLSKGLKVFKGKKITFKFNGKKYISKTNKKGVAKVTIKKSVLQSLKVGSTVKYQAKYGKKLSATKAAKVQK